MKLSNKLWFRKNIDNNFLTKFQKNELNEFEKNQKDILRKLYGNRGIFWEVSRIFTHILLSQKS